MINAKTKSFEFYDNYKERVTSLQPELYAEIKRILDCQLNEFFLRNNRKPIILDVGSMGVNIYDTSMAGKIVILDIFKKPESLSLESNCEWVVGDILSENVEEHLSGEKFDMIIMSSLLHHLCNGKNGIHKNVGIAFKNSARLLSEGGSLHIFESTCSDITAKIEDLLYPLYNHILINLFKFSYVRMLSQREIHSSLRKHGFYAQDIYFKQPEHITQMYWKVQIRVYPLRIICIRAKLG